MNLSYPSFRQYDYKVFVHRSHTCHEKRNASFFRKTSFVSLYRTILASRIQRKTEKEVIFSLLESSLKFLRYAQKLQSIIRCFFQSFHLLFGMSRESFHKPAKLLLCNRTNFGFCPWPLKLTGF